MASIYRRGNVWWVKFHLKGVRIQQSLNTTHERVAQARKSQIEYRLATGTLVMPSETSVGDFLEGFCQYLRGTRTRKSYKNDISYLRIFFGPVCPSLDRGIHATEARCFARNARTGPNVRRDKFSANRREPDQTSTPKART